MKKSNLDWKIEESERVIKKALEKWSTGAVIAFTGGKDSLVILHMTRTLTNKTPPLMFIDHNLHFEETYHYIKKLAKRWKLNIHYEAEPKSLMKLEKEKNMERKRELSRIFKIETINYAVKKHGWKALLVGIRWDEHPARENEKYFSERKNHYRVHPILHFNEKDVWDYIKSYKIPYNPLYDQGYRSLDEKPFTKKVLDPKAPERSGREKDKEEIMERLRALGYF